MDLRKVLALSLALLVVVGFAADSSAQSLAQTQGWTIRMVRPDSAQYVPIGDSIMVNVVRNTTASTAAQEVFVAIFKTASDTAAATTALNSNVTATSATLRAALFNANNSSGPAFQPAFDANGAADPGKYVAAVLTSGTTSGTSITYSFKFKVYAGDGETGTPRDVVAKAFVNIGSGTTAGNTNWRQFATTSTDIQYSTGNAQFDIPVGDLKRFGIDGLRPTNTQIDTAKLSLPRVFTASGGQVFFNSNADTQKAARIGDVVSARLRVSGATGVNSAEILIIPSHVDSQAATAYVKYTYNLTDLFAGGVTKSVTLGEASAGSGDAVQLKKFQNNQRVKAVGFLIDRAGNRSSTASNSASPIGYSTSIVHVIDTTVPVITAVNPDSAGDYVSGVISTSLTGVNVPGAPAKDSTLSIPGKPIRANLSEPVVLLAIGSSATGDTATITQDVTNATNLVAADTAGVTKSSFKFVATDSVGNSATKTIGSIHYDKLPPTATIFPSRGALGQTAQYDTINAATAHSPVVRYNEVLDSLSVRYIQTGSGSNNSHNVIRAGTNLTAPKTDVVVGFVAPDTLVAGNTYSLQVIAIDKARNASITAKDTLLYTNQFTNPSATKFTLTGTATAGASATPDSALAGANLPIKIQAIDTLKSNREAVTYNNAGVIVTVTPDSAHASALSSIVISGTGVDTAGYYGMGKAVLNSAGWTLGARTINVKSSKIMGPFTVSVSDTTGGGSIAGTKSTFVIDETIFSKYSVYAMEDGEITTTGVGGDFGIRVIPTDQYGNWSTKKSGTLDTRSVVKLAEVFVDISSNKGQVSVPSGPQAVAAGGSDFTGVVVSGEGDGLIISAITSSVAGDTSDASLTTDQLSANGRTGSLSFSASGAPPPTTLDPADTLIVQDYMGADGSGDQGGLVLVSIPNTAQHSSLTGYRLLREISVTTGLDSAGHLVTLPAAVQKWISWTVISPDPSGGDGVTRAVVPTLDNLPTRWAVQAERGASHSDTQVAKRVFTKQSVQQMVQLLGVDPNRVFSPEELSDLFAPPADYAKSIIGDQKNLQYAALDPDLASLFSAQAVPQTIRTEGSEVAVSAKTLAAEPVRAVDNIPPAAVTNGAAAPQGSNVVLAWTPSTDDRVVASVTYNGFSLPIMGVHHYNIYGGTGADAMTLIGEAPAGSGSFTVENPQGFSNYRIDALDLDNVSEGGLFAGPGGTGGPIVYRDAEGNRVFIIAVGGNTPLRVDFEDFLAFVQGFNKREGQEGYNVQADLNTTNGQPTPDGVINFADFLLFAGSFNKSAVGGPSTKPIVTPPGLNDGVVMSMDLREDKVLPGQLITVDVSMANVEALQGFGFTVNFDSEKFEFVDAGPAAEDLLKTEGGSTPLFLKHVDGSKVMVANVQDGSPVSGEGAVVTLSFKVLGEFEDQARFDIADAVVFDGENRSNPAVVLGALELQTTPTEFALLQNYPNPFNPETNIKYNLAEGATVNLRIYNIVGQVVRTLVSERQSAGRYQVRWDGTDDRGAAVSSGIYFYQVNAGTFSDVKRLMLLK